MAKKSKSIAKGKSKILAKPLVRTTAQLIYDKESGDHYVIAESVEVAEQILKEDSERGDIVLEDMTYIELFLWKKA